MPGLKREVLTCAKQKVEQARIAKERGDYALAIQLADEARSLADMIIGWHHLDDLLDEHAGKV